MGNLNSSNFFEENPHKRNVIDYYKDWETLAIKGDLDEKRHNFSVVCCNIQGDFNLGTIVRCGNAFLTKEVIIYGKKKFDRRATVGTHNYTHFKHVVEKDLNSLRDTLRGSFIVGVDNIEKAKPIETFIWPKDVHVVMCFGEENGGLPKEILDICNDFVYITQYGSVRSLNVGVASGIAMFSYMTQIGAKNAI